MAQFEFHFQIYRTDWFLKSLFVSRTYQLGSKFEHMTGVRHLNCSVFLYSLSSVVTVHVLQKDPVVNYCNSVKPRIMFKCYPHPQSLNLPNWDTWETLLSYRMASFINSNNISHMPRRVISHQKKSVWLSRTRLTSNF